MPAKQSKKKSKKAVAKKSARPSVVVQAEVPPPHPRLEFRASGIHGTGAFARGKIRKGTRLIEYVGRRLTKREARLECEAGNPFIFTLNARYDLDGSVEWNPARFINHSCEPNAEAEQDDDDRIFLHALRTIQPGEEVTFNYGYGYEDHADNPCVCGVEACVGFIAAPEFHARIRREQARRQREKHVRRATPKKKRAKRR